PRFEAVLVVILLALVVENVRQEVGVDRRANLVGGVAQIARVPVLARPGAVRPFQKRVVVKEQRLGQEPVRTYWIRPAGVGARTLGGFDREQRSFVHAFE